VRQFSSLNYLSTRWIGQFPSQYTILDTLKQAADSTVFRETVIFVSRDVMATHSSSRVAIATRQHTLSMKCTAFPWKWQNFPIFSNTLTYQTFELKVRNTLTPSFWQSKLKFDMIIIFIGNSNYHENEKQFSNCSLVEFEFWFRIHVIFAFIGVEKIAKLDFTTYPQNSGIIFSTMMRIVGVDWNNSDYVIWQQ
jgi:hypothetical protein